MRSPRANSVVHLELHTGDLPGAVAFYGQLFGWRPERIRAGRGSYLTLGLGDRVGGGIVESEASHPLWLPYVVVPDIARAAGRAEALGSEVLLEPLEGPKGWRSVVSGPDGGDLGIWQPKRL